MVDFTSRTLLAIGGGIEAVPIAETAKNIGTKLLLVDRNPECPCRNIADLFFPIDTYDAKEILAKALDYTMDTGPIHGVLAMCADVPYSVATVATGLGLRGIGLKAATFGCDKMLQKKRLKQSGIPVPEHMPVNSFESLKKARDAFGFPFILKPVDSRGARGVLQITQDLDLQWAYDFSLSFSPSKKLIAEEYLHGPQLSTESIILGNTFHHIGFSDRNYEYLERFSPFIVENGGELPSSLPKEEIERVKALIETASRALGFDVGTVKGDIVITENGPYVIELAPRLSGGFFASHEIPLNTGVDFVKAAIQLALGLEPNLAELRPRTICHVVQRYFFPPSGKLLAIEGLKKIQQYDWLKLIHVFYKPGDIIPKITSHVTRGGVFIVIGNSREEAMARAHIIYDTVKWIVS